MVLQGVPLKMINNKVLLIHNILWSHSKGAVFSALHDLCRRNGKNLEVIQIAATDGACKSIGQIDFSQHRYPCRLLFEDGIESIGVLQRSVALGREIIAQRPDMVILPGYYDISFWLALLVVKLLRIPAILTFDSTVMDWPRVWYKELIKKIYVHLCDAAFVYGTQAKKYLGQLGMPEQRIFIRYQATINDEIAAINLAARHDRDKQQARNGLKPRNFIYVGRLSGEKNVATLIQAFHILKGRESAANDWGLLVVGNGPLREELVELCSMRGIADVHFIGGKSWRELPEYYAMSDVLVLPSTSEPWGAVVNEAMVCGLPVLVSNRCGAAYDLLIEGENGFVFDPCRVAELADRMEYFIDNPGRIAEMGVRSSAIIAEYTPEHTALQMYSGIEQLLPVQTT